MFECPFIVRFCLARPHKGNFGKRALEIARISSTFLATYRLEIVAILSLCDWPTFVESIVTVVRRWNLGSDVLQLVNRSGSSNRIQTIEVRDEVTWSGLVLMMRSKVDPVSSRVIGGLLLHLNVVSVWQFVIGRYFLRRVALTYFVIGALLRDDVWMALYWFSKIKCKKLRVKWRKRPVRQINVAIVKNAVIESDNAIKSWHQVVRSCTRRLHHVLLYLPCHRY